MKAKKRAEKLELILGFIFTILLVWLLVGTVNIMRQYDAMNQYHIRLSSPDIASLDMTVPAGHFILKVLLFPWLSICFLLISFHTEVMFKFWKWLFKRSS